jgi:CRP-like cAMP-binding protein
MKNQASLAASPDHRGNTLLAEMEPEEQTVLLAGAKVVSLKLGKRLYRPDEPISAVYFPINSMVSLLAGSGTATPLELATIGKEGVIGAAEVQLKQGAMGLLIVQIPGTAVRVEAETFRTAMGSLPRIEDIMHRHFYALTRQILQGAACNRRHSMEERCARWLLMTHDRAANDVFPLTQEFLSRMLGVRRATVNVAIGMLKKAGFVRYVRGMVTVTDRPGLESASCECYEDIVKQYELLLPDGHHR